MRPKKNDVGLLMVVEVLIPWRVIVCMTSPKILEKLIAIKRAKLARLDEHIGALMSQRVDEEEKLAELLNKQNKPMDPRKDLVTL